MRASVRVHTWNAVPQREARFLLRGWWRGELARCVWAFSRRWTGRKRGKGVQGPIRKALGLCADAWTGN